MNNTPQTEQMVEEAVQEERSRIREKVEGMRNPKIDNATPGQEVIMLGTYSRALDDVLEALEERKTQASNVQSLGVDEASIPLPLVKHKKKLGKSFLKIAKKAKESFDEQDEYVRNMEKGRT